MDPPPTRREALPTPKQKDDNSSIWSIMWSILKESLGKDLTHITLPFFFNEPLSVLQKTMEDLEYADLLNKVHRSWLHCCMRSCVCHRACPAELMSLQALDTCVSLSLIVGLLPLSATRYVSIVAWSLFCMTCMQVSGQKVVYWVLSICEQAELILCSCYCRLQPSPHKV